MPEHHRRKRIIRLVAAAVTVEIGLLVAAKLGPAFAAILRTGMLVAAVAFGIAIWHASRSRRGEDRRAADRRGHDAAR